MNPAKFAFLPLQVVALARPDDLQAHSRYRLAISFDGSLRLKAMAPSSIKGPFLLTVPPAGLLRRRARVAPTTREQTRLLAQDVFPLDSEGATFGTARLADGTYLVALEKRTFETFVDHFGTPAALLVAEPDPSSILTAIHDRLSLGTITDLHPAPKRFVPPSGAVSAALSIVFVASLGIFATVWSVRSEARLEALTDEVARLEQAVAPLIEKRRATIRMHESLQVLSKQEPARTARALVTMQRIVDALPPGSWVEELEFDGSTITVKGFSNGARRWLADLGVKQEDVAIFGRPKTDGFEARLAAVAAVGANFPASDAGQAGRAESP